MKNLFGDQTRKEIIERINLLDENSCRLWGKMTPNEMLCHCSDQIKMATGNLKTDFVGNFFTSTIGKQVVLLGVPVPKGKVETVKELMQGVRGTPPTKFDEDRNMLINLVNTFDAKYPSNNDPVHPAFGKLTRNQWGKLSYIHLDHHLKQFGI